MFGRLRLPWWQKYLILKVQEFRLRQRHTEVHVGSRGNDMKRMIH